MGDSVRQIRGVGRHRAPARRPAATSVAFVLGVTVAVTLTASPARADGPVPLTGLAAYQPSLSPWYTPEQVDECLAGSYDCVPVTIGRMSAILDARAASCDHLAPFALAYLRTTQEYQTVAAQPGFFQDAPFVNVEDAFFAAYFFDAYDNWNSGATTAVPRAWQIAFGAARDRTMSGLGDILLGMNAHINRDLPYILAGLGLVAPDGTSRHADHEKVNVFLNMIVTSLLDEEAARFDPTVNDLKSPYGITYDAFMAIIVGWRENAWLNAQRLVAAHTPAERSGVEASIETESVVLARGVQTAFGYPPLLNTGLAASRDRYCAAHHG
ncbi:DUF5995 family protein [Pseudofrankia sp. DC12]|uniref:DUF5995 family protein n=1 Tax=Pseudofrankia sp. DC12 TaxID=683315 RepID=UPI000AD48F3F|nr:DUF5995 family protein [Pseudofrankia sp. DC12]